MIKDLQAFLRSIGCRSVFLIMVFVVALAASLAGCRQDASVEDLVGNTGTGTTEAEPEVDETGLAGNEVRQFNHPGLLHAEADFARIREKVQNEEEPWASAWNDLVTDGISQLGKTPAPLETVIRGGDGQNFGRLVAEIRFSYALALRWKISRDDRYGDLAVDYLNAWSSTLKTITGDQGRYLAAGLYGYEFANVAEIMRTYDGWAEADIKQFQDMLVTVFYPLSRRFLREHNDACISNYWANWDLANIAGIQAIGVFADRPDIYQEAMDYLYTGEGNGALDNLVFHLHAGNMGQYQESGRDQGHTTLGVALYGAIAKMAWNQGEDVFEYWNHRLLAASEYIARYNLLEEVPYTPYGPNCGSVMHVPQWTVSDKQRGHSRPAWELIYNHYVNRLGMAAPWTEKMAARQRPERSSWGGDELGWGTLTETLEPAALGGAPRGLTGNLSGGTVELSWWGAAGAESYRLKRASAPDAVYATIATRGAEEFLTYTDTDVSEGEDYYYQVTAISSEGESAASNTVTVRVGPKLMVYFPFDAAEDGGFASSVDDTVVATPNNGPALVPGKLGNAISLDGADDYVSLQEGIVSELADFSITSWVYIDGTTDMARLFDFGFGTQRYMALVPRDRDNQMCFFITRISYHADQKICGNPAPVGEWAHVAMSLSGTTGILYLNGGEVGRNDNMVLAPFRLGVSTQNWLGDSQYGNDAFLDGKIDDFRIYSGALSAAQIAALAAE
ncbi:LamG-like jellyroll fold domain-containing protein [Marinobacter sp. DUT-3]|uniref:LamG-like jellyroll fold domain-containing protein n=1 Tax=Marinobacter sp. DUT-3 TaxID=3412036 RepID=UPI003D1754DF